MGGRRIAVPHNLQSHFKRKLHELLICQLPPSCFHIALSQLRKLGIAISPHQLSVINNEQHQTNNKKQPTKNKVYNTTIKQIN